MHGLPLLAGVFHLAADILGIAIQGERFERGLSVGLTAVADHMQQVFERLRQAARTQGAEKHEAEIGIFVALDGILQERGRGWEPGRAESEGGLFSDGSELGLEEAGEERQCLIAFQLQETVEDLSDDFGFGVALARFEAQEEDGLVALHLRDGAHGVVADGKSAVGEGIDEMAQNLTAADIGAGGKGQGAGAAEGRGSVSFPAPDGLHLDVMHAADERGGLAMVERDEGFGDGVFAPALGVALGGLFEEAVEGADEVGNQLVEAEFGGQFGGFGDDQVDAVGKSFLERGDGVGGRGVAQ